LHTSLPREDSGKIFKQRLKAAYMWSLEMKLVHWSQKQY
jgi:hypothetical protein